MLSTASSSYPKQSMLPLLFTLVSATAFSLLSEVRLSLPRPYQSACMLGNRTLFTWTDLTSVWACAALGSSCEPHRLGPGFRSSALCDDRTSTYEVLAGSNTTLSVHQLTSDGKPLHSVSLQTRSPKDLTGLVLDAFVLVVWTAQTKEGDSDVYGCVLDSSLALRHPVFQVNSFVQGNQFAPSAYRRDNKIQVVWESAGYHKGIFSQLLTLDGTKVGTETCLSPTGHKPQLLEEGLFLLNRSGSSPQLIFGLSTHFNSFTPMWEVETRQEDYTFLPATLDSDLYLLFSSLDVNSLGSVRLRKSSPTGCILNKYSPLSPASSHLHGRLLSVSAQTLTLLFYDARLHTHVLQQLSNPRNSLCLWEQPPTYPEWTKPALSLEPRWKKPLLVTGSCLAFLLSLAAAVFMVRLLVKRFRRQRTPEGAEMQPSQAKDDSSLVLFEVGTPCSPDKPSNS